jgi:hypothetical protein
MCGVRTTAIPTMPARIAAFANQGFMFFNNSRFLR